MTINWNMSSNWNQRVLQDNNSVEGYQLFVNSGCATENNNYPKWGKEIKQFGPDQEGPCHQYCVETQGCKYFEFEHKTGSCHLHNQEMTKSNGYPGVKCFKMLSGNNQCFVAFRIAGKANMYFFLKGKI